MGRTAVVLSSAHVTDGGGHGVDVTCDPDGGRIVTAPHFANAGVDALALPGDSVALEDSSGTGCEQATGYADTANAGKAAPGEVRLYARDSSGAVKGDVWLKGDGTIVATNGGGTLTLSPDGVLSVGGSSDAAALASVVDALLKALAACTPAPAVAPDAGEPGLAAIKLAMADFLTSASALLKVGG
jgi:hypothetical protein